MNNINSLNEKLQFLITDELMQAMGLSHTHWFRPVIHAFVKRGTRHFADVCAQLDFDIGTIGFTPAVRRFAKNFISGCHHYGVNHIPSTGPVLITSNHPGAADSVTILTLINREDVKIVLTGVPFTSALNYAQKHFIRVKSDTETRSQVIRDIIHHLKDDGVVVIFPTGHVTPDPGMNPNPQIVLEDWSQSIAIIMRSVPETKLLMTVISGVIEPRFLNSPLCKIRKSKWRQQILAEFMQITWQMMRPGTATPIPRVTFMPPINGKSLMELASKNGPPTRQEIHNVILTHAEEGVSKHIEVHDDVLFTSFE